MTKIDRLLFSSIPVPITLVMILVTIVILLPMVHIYAQQQGQQIDDTTPSDTVVQTTTSDSLVQLINSIALLVGVVAPLIVSGLAYVKSKSQDPRIQEAAETGIRVGQIATATANKAVEDKQHIKELLELGLRFSPEDAKKVLAERQELIEKLNKEILATQAQIKRITPMIPGQANADTIADLPREKDF
jgi:hypothetical protein